MSPVRQATHVLSAFLETDGSITMIVLFPDSEQAIMTTVDPIETTIQAAGPVPRRIDLTYGAPADRHLRLIVAMHADALAYERELEQATSTLRRELPSQPRAEPPVEAAPAPDDWAEALAVAAALDIAPRSRR
jgi:hypothetical protein